MKPWLKALLLVFVLTLCGGAMVADHLARKHVPPPSARELYSVINRQLSALRASDFESAYQRAAAGVQEKFSRTQFELMIRRDFASMTETSEVEFGAVAVTGATALVQVFLTTADGATREYLYSFSAEGGGWKINGVQSLGREPLRQLPGMRI